MVKLEKVLQQGDISDCAEPYIKDAESSKVRISQIILRVLFIEDVYSITHDLDEEEIDKSVAHLNVNQHGRDGGPKF